MRSHRANNLRGLPVYFGDGMPIGLIGPMTIPYSGGDRRTYAIIGAAMEVHGILHRGFLEAIYCEALAREFKLREIPFHTQVPCSVEYKGDRLRGFYKLDFVCYNDVIVEVKANSITGPADHAQVLNYLAVSGHRTALLLNFGRRSLEHKRFVMGDATD